MKREDKKRVERCYLENFLKLLGKTPDQIECGESPDFVVTLRGKRIGIEVTEYHSGLRGAGCRPRRAFEEEGDLLYQNISEEAKKYPELEGIGGSFSFKNLGVPPKSKHQEFIFQVIQLTREKAQDVIHKNSLKIEPNERFSLLKQYVKKLLLYNTGLPFHPHWGGIDVSFIAMNEDEFIAAIQPKINKSRAYREKMIKKGINKLWLLIVSGWSPSQTMPPLEHLEYKLKSFDRLNDALKTSEYNKVYLYQYMSDAIYEWPEWKRKR